MPLLARVEGCICQDFLCCLLGAGTTLLASYFCLSVLDSYLVRFRVMAVAKATVSTLLSFPQESYAHAAAL